jgi:hypothetical protein
VNVVTAQRTLFDVLRVRPALGRVFTAEEDAPHGPQVVIIGDALWRTRYGADPAIIGRTLTLDGIVREVVGIMPASFAFPTPRRSCGCRSAAIRTTSAASTRRASAGSARA